MIPVDRNTGLTPIIIEIKRKNNDDKNIDCTAERALKQIEDKKYYQDPIYVGSPKIYLYGFGFEKKVCSIKMKIHDPKNEIGDLAST